MKLISLNTWGGRAGKENLLSFFDKHKDSVDVFCLQEMWSAPYDDYEGVSAGGKPLKNDEIMVYGLKEISDLLVDFEPYFHPHVGDNYGLLTMVRKNLSVVEVGEVFVHKQRGYVPEGDMGGHARNIQYVTIKKDSGLTTFVNFHGLWNGKGKTDTEDRLTQSENILNFIKTLQGKIIFCGDFNLLPETDSIKKFEVEGLKNLVREYDIKSTRTSFYTKPEKHADYAFVSNDVKVNNFEVLPDEVSDHSPLLLDFE